MKRAVWVVCVLATFNACANGAAPPPRSPSAYLDYSGRDDVLTGGVKMIPISTPKGTFKVWTKRTGNNPTMKVLLQLLIPNFYVEHILRMPPDQWPDGVNRAFKRLNEKVYIPMQGPSEMGASGKLVNWERTSDLGKITVPTLTIGAKYDTMDPAQMEKMAGLVKKGRFLFCPNGSHMAMYDDQKIYFDGVVKFVRDVDQGSF